MYMQSRSTRWLGLLRRVRPELQLAIAAGTHRITHGNRENVQGSDLRRDLTLCGEMFGLNVIRHATSSATSP
jgi:hypothetical protein